MPVGLMSVMEATFRFMIIDCQTCTKREIACADCVVTVLMQILPAGEITHNHAQAISVLSEKGLVPPLRFAQ